VIGLLAHAGRATALDVEERTARWLSELGHEVRRLTAMDAAPGPDGRSPAEPTPALEGMDLIVSLGGDGTMLRTVRLAAPAAIPVLGVNLGHLGYLTVVEPDGLSEALQRFLAGEHRIDARMTLEVVVRDASGVVTGRRLALNDVVLQRPGGLHTIRVQVSVSGRSFVRFAADALIVATPTGSTAYNLSARGPIASPGSRVQILTPVAPHSLFDRSLVVSADEPITIVPEADRLADLVVDGYLLDTLKPNQEVEVRAGPVDARLVSFGERDFEGILLRKFHLAED